MKRSVVLVVSLCLLLIGSKTEAAYRTYRPLLLEVRITANYFGPGSSTASPVAEKIFFYAANQRTFTLTPLGSDPNAIVAGNYSRRITLVKSVNVLWSNAPPAVDWNMIDDSLTYEFVNQAIGRYGGNATIPLGSTTLRIPAIAGPIGTGGGTSPCDSCQN